MSTANTQNLQTRPNYWSRNHVPRAPLTVDDLRAGTPPRRIRPERSPLHTALHGGAWQCVLSNAITDGLLAHVEELRRLCRRHRLKSETPCTGGLTHRSGHHEWRSTTWQYVALPGPTVAHGVKRYEQPSAAVVPPRLLYGKDTNRHARPSDQPCKSFESPPFRQ
jgi:hypothetical protein